MVMVSATARTARSVSISCSPSGSVVAGSTPVSPTSWMSPDSPSALLLAPNRGFGRCKVGVIAAIGSAGVGRVPTGASLMHAGVVVSVEAHALGACADVLAEVARGGRRYPRAHRQYRSRQDCSDGSKPGDLFEHWYRLDFVSCVRRVRLA